MSRILLKLLFGLVALLAVAPVASYANDGPIDRDWRTGVTVAPGAMTWTSDNYANKKQLIDDVAAGLGKACTDNYAFLGWAIGNGGPQVIVQTTRANYEKDGYTITQKPGKLDTDIVWLAHKEGREAVILWSAVAGSTIYFSCLTAGAPAPNPEKPLYLGVVLAIGLGALLTGLWIFRRVRHRAMPH